MTTLAPAAMIVALEAEAAKLSLSRYAKLVSPDTYQQPDHVLMLIDYLEALERRDITRLIVEMPPRSSKSSHVSRLFPSWWLGRHPADGVILASYGEELATGHGRAVRDLLGHPRYPFATRLRADNRAAGRWETNAGGGLIASGVGTGLTGFGGTLCVLDDPIKGREEADSELVRDHTWAWYQEVFLTRVQREGVVVVMGTRWHEDDPIGRILATAGAGDWERLRIPYLAEVDDPLERDLNEPLEVFGTVPSVEKGEISAYGFSALYQQRPTPAGGGVFKSEWLQRRYCVGHLDGRTCPFNAKPLPKREGRWRTVSTYDLGGKQGVGHDPSAIATWGTDGISKYLIDYWSAQDEYVLVKAEALRRHYEHRPWMHYIEDATWAQPLISDLRQAGLKVYPVPPVGSKWTRADDVSGDFSGGQVVLPCSAPWLPGWLHELTGFPNAAHDEAVDTTSLALSMLGGVSTRARTLKVVVKGGTAKRDRVATIRERLTGRRSA